MKSARVLIQQKVGDSAAYSRELSLNIPMEICRRCSSRCKCAKYSEKSEGELQGGDMSECKCGRF